MFKVKVGLHQRLTLSPSLFARLTDEVRKQSPWTMMSAGDIVICSKGRDQVGEKLKRWRFPGKERNEG